MTAARLPYAPLERLLVRRQPTHLPPTAEDQAGGLGVTDRTIFRYRIHGLSELQADRAAVAIGVHPAAVAIGVHPAAVWGTDFYADLNLASLPGGCDSEPQGRPRDPGNLPVVEVAHSHDMTDQSHQGAAA